MGKYNENVPRGRPMYEDIRMKKKQKKKHPFLKAVALIAVLLILGNIVINRFVFVKRYSVSAGEEKTGAEAIKIVQLSDIHSIRSEWQKNMLLKKVKSEEPDIIAVTGDLIDTDHYTRQQNLLAQGKIERVEDLTIEFMSELTEIAGTYFVYGNHEMMLLDDEKNNSFVNALKDSGVIYLNNKAANLRLNDRNIWLLGIQDPATVYKDEKFAFLETMADKTEAMLKYVIGNTKTMIGRLEALTAGDGAEVSQKPDMMILLAHRPEFMDIYAEYDIDLVLAGHTHGGIMRVPLLGGLYTRAEGLFPTYSYGKYIKGDTTMLVSGGIGYIKASIEGVKIPVRAFNPPEITVITIE